jgi:3-hydroxybutyrate dehydrogenase
MSATPLKGKIAIVTGATDGAGHAIARALAAQGMDLMLNGGAAALGTLREEIERDHGVRVRQSDVDLAESDAARGLVEAAAESFGRVDVLVNNAGLQFTAPVERFPAGKWDAILALNLSAAFHGIAAALPLMKRQGWGRIVNIASTHGLVGSAYKAAYVAAGHGLIGLTKAVGLEAAGTGVTVNALCPGWVRTPLIERQIAELAGQSRISREQAAVELLSDRQPSRGFVTPEQLGDTVVFLCSPAADQITGTAIAVDGGWTRQ